MPALLLYDIINFSKLILLHFHAERIMSDKSSLYQETRSLARLCSSSMCTSSTSTTLRTLWKSRRCPGLLRTAMRHPKSGTSFATTTTVLCWTAPGSSRRGFLGRARAGLMVGLGVGELARLLLLSLGLTVSYFLSH